MKRIIADLKRYSGRSLALLACLVLASFVLLAVAVLVVSSSGVISLVTWSLMALALCLTTARYPLRFPGTYCSVSISEAIFFLAIIILGPYHAALLVVVDVVAAGRRLKLKIPSLYLFNAANQTISIFAAGKLYYGLSDYLNAHPILSGAGQKMLAFALPLVAMALSHYTLHMIVVSLMAHLRHGAKLGNWARDTLPWEPVTYVAGATVAGLIPYAFREYGAVATLVAIALALPIPVIIYYAFKTNHEKLNEQEKHYKELTGVYDSILETLAMAIEAKDELTRDHLQRVKLFAVRVGEKVGLSEIEIEALKAGALLHNIGMMGVPAYILNKPGKLTEHEYEQVKMHPVIGADMLSNINFRFPVVPIVRHHHERWDGGGYPDGLRGEEIPLTARILTLVDDYDGLRLDKPYRKAVGREEALDHIRQNAGTIFDPRLVEIFLPLIEQIEAEAAALNLMNRNGRNRAESLSPAAPGADPAQSQVDRARAALNSIAETNQRVTALYEMTRTLASTMSVEDTVAILANHLAGLIPFTTCAISLFDASRSEFKTVQAVGRHAEKFVKRRQPLNAGGITGWVIQNLRPMRNTPPALDLEFLDPAVADEYRVAMVVPLMKNGEALGAIALYSAEFETYGSDRIQLMESVCQTASDALHNALSLHWARQAAVTSPFTGLANMRTLTALFEREFARSQRLGSSLSLIAITVANLDEAAQETRISSVQILNSLSKLIRQEMRETDVLASHSINGFIALLPDSGQVEVSKVRERIGDAILNAHRDWGLSLSLGTATCPRDGSRFEELLLAAQMDCIANRAPMDSILPSLRDVFASRPSIPAPGRDAYALTGEPRKSA